MAERATIPLFIRAQRWGGVKSVRQTLNRLAQWCFSVQTTRVAESGQHPLAIPRRLRRHTWPSKIRQVRGIARQPLLRYCPTPMTSKQDIQRRLSRSTLSFILFTEVIQFRIFESLACPMNNPFLP